MTRIINTTSRRRLSAKLGAGLALAALLAVGTFTAPASAQQYLPYGYGYYAAPPVAYGWPYGYYAPPYGYYSQPLPYGDKGQPQPYYAPPH